MSLLFTFGNTLFVVLDEENIERIPQNDPCDITPRWTGALSPPIHLPLQLVIAYAHTSEYDKIAKMQGAEVVRYLRRGFKITESDRKRDVVFGKLNNE